MNWNILIRELLSDQSENFPLFPLTRKFRRFTYLGLQQCEVPAKNRFSNKWHPSTGNQSKRFQFSILNSDFMGKFSDLQHFSKFVKNHVFGPISVRSFSEIQRETFEVEIFPIFSTSKKIFFFCRIARIGTFCRGNFFPKNRKFFHFFHQLENSDNLFIRAYKCANFQQKIFSEKKQHPKRGISKISNFQT